MKIMVVGAGAMGGSFAGLLAVAGHELRIIDTDIAHVEAINGALIREANELGIATPYNQSLVALLKGREQSQIRRINEPNFDYAAWEARIVDGKEQ